MKNFQPGGLRNRRPDLGGRPQSDVNNYAPKKRFDSKPTGKFGDKKFGDKKDVTLYKATCTTCGAACEVPFRPDGSKPVLCRDCFAAKNAAPTNATNRDRFTANELVGHKPQRDYGAPVAPRPVARDSADYALLVKQLAVVEGKVNQILELIKASETLVRALPVIHESEVAVTESAEPTKVRKPKKVTPAIKKAAVKKKATVAKKTAKKAAKKVAK
jgi:CxxC-x17-CxxC domain-containing protein